MGSRPYSYVIHSHELYNMGHLYEAAVAYARALPAGAPVPPRADDAAGRARLLHTMRSMTATLWPLVLSTFARGAGAACVAPSMACRKPSFVAV